MREYAEDADPRRLETGKALVHRQRAIEEALNRLDTEEDRLAETLAPVLGPERPSPALAGGGSADDPGSDLGRALEHYASRIDAYAARLAYTIDRIDL